MGDYVSISVEEDDQEKNLLRHAITKAIKDKNTESFRGLLGQKPTKIDEYSLTSNDKFSITIVIRDLVNLICDAFKNIKRPGSKFIEECFRTIEDHYEIGVVNCAAWLVDPKFMKNLLSYPDISVDSKYQNLTPLNILAKNLNAGNFDDTFECIKLLVDYGANPNFLDEENKTPLSHLKDKNQLGIEKIIDFFLEHADITIPNIEIPTKSFTTFSSSELLEEFHILDIYWNNIQDKTRTYTTYEQLLELFILAIQYKLHKAFDVIIETGLNINFRCRGYTPIKTACYYGNWKALRKLLKKLQKDKKLKLRKTDKLLITVILRIKKATDDELSDYYSCFHTLLDSNEISINETDHKLYSVLHYAVRVNKSNIIREVLERGAYIGAKNIYDKLAINAISTDILEEYFDSCITTNKSLECDEPISSITINYLNLIPLKIDEQFISQYSTEMDVIEHIAESDNLCNLLKHPLILSFLHIKWSKMERYFDIDSLVYSYVLIFCQIIVMTNIVHGGKPTEKVLFFLSFIFILVWLIIRESIKVIICPSAYIKDLVNLVTKLILIILIIINFFGTDFDIEIQKIVAVLTIVLTVVEIYLVYSSNTFTSTLMLMFTKVSKTFSKSLFSLGFLILGYGHCFLILFELERIKSINTTGNITKNYTELNDNRNEKFQLLYIKPIVMMLGEINVADIKFHSLFNYIVFLVFLFFITIVLYNLLNGLAVGDIQAVIDDAELRELINKTKILSKYCKILKKNTNSIHKNIKPNRISQIFFNKDFQNLVYRFRRFLLDNFILIEDGIKICKIKIKIHNKTIYLIRNDSVKLFLDQEIFGIITKSVLDILKKRQNSVIEKNTLELENNFKKINDQLMLIEERIELMDNRLIQLTKSINSKKFN